MPTTSSPSRTSPTWSKEPTPSCCDGALELSVVVPVYNEAANLAAFFEELGRQREVRLELIISDGGSSDETAPVATTLAAEAPFPVRLLRSQRGRGAQMNLGASLAAAPTLLFLHIDSSLADRLALRKGLDALGAARVAAHGRAAGHFALEFDFGAGAVPLPYRFYGLKATLDRPGCTHGDQGLLIAADFFREIGPFDSALPLMEDTFLADRIRRNGRLILLPARLRTSPRRFLAEGLLPRQTLNAILMNLAHIGRFELIASLKGCYRSQDAATRLRLAPFLARLKSEIAKLPPADRRSLWLSTGGYVRGNAWQIALLLDLLFFGGSDGRGGSCLWLHDRLVGRLLDNRVADALAAGLVRLWFQLALRMAR